MRPTFLRSIVVALAVAATGCRGELPATRDSALSASWIASADSALRRSLARSVIGGDTTAPAAPDFHDCDEEGSDNLPMFVTAVSAVPVGHGAPERDSTSFDAPVTNLAYRIAVRSVARFTPASGDSSIHVEMRLPSDSTEWYEAFVSPRVDTMTLTVTDYGEDAGRPRWAVCDLFGRLPDVESPYFGFLPRAASWIRVVRWSPAGASWARIRALADSLRGAGER